MKQVGILRGALAASGLSGTETRVPLAGAGTPLSAEGWQWAALRYLGRGDRGQRKVRAGI